MRWPDLCQVIYDHIYDLYQANTLIFLMKNKGSNW